MTHEDDYTYILADAIKVGDRIVLGGSPSPPVTHVNPWGSFEPNGSVQLKFQGSLNCDLVLASQSYVALYTPQSDLGVGDCVSSEDLQHWDTDDDYWDDGRWDDDPSPYSGTYSEE